ncbi:phosphate uptake regulator PhoU [Thermococcus indicus]|uniref:Phosphate uptake regulator PhoU n=1 Tax=Thermococcus indicus TaxID=2586643 RepID=A0A4Y5SJY3_9EURY|nr:phosphate uptake regulator PhoU [Thermococcus indicus]QDA31146.1 phosphate uptake regulator PhoU [Thermococcus indicus]
MRKLLDIGMKQIRKLLNEMGENAVTALENAKASFGGETDGTEDIASKMHIIRGEVLDIATELLVRYSPMASDLRFIQSAVDVSYDLYRISRYAMEIERTVKILRPRRMPELSERGFEITVRAVRTALGAFENLNEVDAGRLLELDDAIDELYLRSLEELEEPDKEKALNALVLRHLERICDHATEIGAKVIYVKDGRRI